MSDMSDNDLTAEEFDLLMASGESVELVGHASVVQTVGQPPIGFVCRTTNKTFAGGDVEYSAPYVGYTGRIGNGAETWATRPVSSPAHA